MILLTSLVLVITTISQQSPVPDNHLTREDSLLLAVELEVNPDEKAKIYLQLSTITQIESSSRSLEYLRTAIKWAETDSLLAAIWDQKGRLHFSESNFDVALSSFRTAKTYMETAGNLSVAARINNRMGVTLLRKKYHQQALETLLESATFFEQTGDQINLAICYTNMAGVFADMSDFQNAITYNEQALGIFREYDIKQYEIITLTNLAGQYLKTGNRKRSLDYNLRAEKLGAELDDPYALGIVYNNIGQYYFEVNNLEKALEYYKKSLFSKQNNRIGADLVPTYNNLGQIFIQLGRIEEAVQNLKMGIDEAGGNEELWQLYSNLAKAYIRLGKADSAGVFFDLAFTHRDSLFTIERQQAIDEIRTKYETERTEREILELEARQQQTRHIIYGLIGLFITTIFVAFLMVKNNRKKRIIAEQNEKLEKQHVEKLLMDQEMTGIHAMFEGREKERKKIAEELHDTIGNTLATLKLYLGSLKTSSQKKDYKVLHARAGEVLEEAYDQIRSIAHNKGDGVFIGKGLVPAVRSMAQKISEARKVHIEVIGTALEKRLESSAEIPIFRSIQELISNAVKHSKASEIVIQITQHEKMLNIVVEDNGIGFDPDHTRWGLGFTNIKNRLDELGGKFVIDSSPGYGTTVILNIPVSQQ